MLKSSLTSFAHSLQPPYPEGFFLMAEQELPRGYGLGVEEPHPQSPQQDIELGGGDEDMVDTPGSSSVDPPEGSYRPIVPSRTHQEKMRKWQLNANKRRAVIPVSEQEQHQEAHDSWFRECMSRRNLGTIAEHRPLETGQLQVLDQDIQKSVSEEQVDDEGIDQTQQASSLLSTLSSHISTKDIPLALRQFNKNVKNTSQWKLRACGYCASSIGCRRCDRCHIVGCKSHVRQMAYYAQLHSEDPNMAIVAEHPEMVYVYCTQCLSQMRRWHNQSSPTEFPYMACESVLTWTTPENEQYQRSLTRGGASYSRVDCTPAWTRTRTATVNNFDNVIYSLVEGRKMILEQDALIAARRIQRRDNRSRSRSTSPTSGIDIIVVPSNRSRSPMSDR